MQSSNSQAERLQGGSALAAPVSQIGTMIVGTACSLRSESDGDHGVSECVSQDPRTVGPTSGAQRERRAGAVLQRCVRACVREGAQDASCVVIVLPVPNAAE